MPKLFSDLKTAAALLLAGFCLWLFHERYWTWRDCIAEARSSCLTPGGDNLTSGGMIWIVPATTFGLIALRRILRRIAHARRRGG